MNSKERFRCLLAKQVPDRVLRDYWAVPEIDARLRKHYEVSTQDELLDKLHIDFRYIEGPKYIGPSLARHDDGSEDDIFGVPRKTIITGEGEFRGSYKAVTRYPLAECTSVDEVLAYDKWPSADWYDYSPIEEQCELVGDRVAVFMGDRLNRVSQLKPAMYLRGVDKILADMARKNNEIFVAIRDKIREFYNEYLRRILDSANGNIDLIVTGDDFGTQQGPFCRLATWRDNLMPGFKEYISICKDASIPVMHHTCGSISSLIPSFIECGLDILNPLQPLVYDMDHAAIKHEFGERIAFHGGVSLQGPLRFGTPSEVTTEVQQRINDLGADGRYIICTAHNIQADTPTENIIALFEAYEEYS
ncbi:MAG TPA: uroporphyrinogen decarboxylase family protein [Candidatus Lokiarchaeia archaeon]|nr:uroporphyrinogen decarboxylase family protein [Candidatus Lokiarchaeia archaeon]